MARLSTLSPSQTPAIAAEAAPAIDTAAPANPTSSTVVRDESPTVAACRTSNG